MKETAVEECPTPFKNRNERIKDRVVHLEGKLNVASELFRKLALEEKKLQADREALLDELSFLRGLPES